MKAGHGAPGAGRCTMYYRPTFLHAQEKETSYRVAPCYIGPVVNVTSRESLSSRYATYAYETRARKRIPRVRSIGYRFVVACECLRENRLTRNDPSRVIALIGRSTGEPERRGAQR